MLRIDFFGTPASLSLYIFVGIDAKGERRVANVKIGGKPVDLAKTYTLAGSEYVLIQGGDGLTMLAGSEIVSSEGLPCDSEMIIQYFTQTLGGKITAAQYGKPNGDGRITINDSEPVILDEPTPDTPDEPEDEACAYCGKVHTDFFSEIICFVIRIINFIKNLFV